MDNNPDETVSQPEPPMHRTDSSQQPCTASAGSKKDRSLYVISAVLAVGCLPWFILGCMLVILSLAIFMRPVSPAQSQKHIALIRVEGEIITGESREGLASSFAAGSETIISQLENARKSPKAKGILLRIDSPGGSPAASEEVFNEIMRIRRSGKPVYVSMGDLAASGGYYIASAADKIYADSATLTGSIGVIWRSADLSKLYKTIGYSPEVVKAGKYKDFTSSYRPMTPEEKAMVQRLVDNTHEDFMEAVSTGRRIPLADVRRLANGMVYDGKQAKKLRLVDEIGGMEEARRAIGQMCRLGSDARLVDYRETTLLSDLLSASGVSSEDFGASLARGAIKAMQKQEGELH